LGGAIQLAQPDSYEIHAFLYARDGLQGPRAASARVVGNLACETLNRDRMPATFECWFDSSFVSSKMGRVGGWLLSTDDGSCGR
jgi:hypothetical protein